MYKNILLLDDNPDILHLIRKILKADDHTVYIFEKQIEAMNFLKENPERVDLMIIDYMMPESSGFQFIEELHKDTRLKIIPFFILSSYKDPEILNKTNQLKSLGFISKPVDGTELREKIRNLYFK